MVAINSLACHALKLQTAEKETPRREGKGSGSGGCVEWSSHDFFK